MKDAAIIEARVREGLPLAAILARQMRRQLGSSLDIDELESVGREALLAAAKSFDSDRGVPFRRWANLRMRGAMIDAVRSRGGLPRRVYRQLRAMEAADRVADNTSEEKAAAPAQTAEAADAALSSTLSGMAMAMAAAFLTPMTEGIEQVEGGEERADEAFERRQLLAVIRAVIDERPDAERTLLVRHYFEGITFEQAAAGLGLSKSWASRLHARAIEAVALEVRRRIGS